MPLGMSVNAVDSTTLIVVITCLLTKENRFVLKMLSNIEKITTRCLILIDKH